MPAGGASSWSAGDARQWRPDGTCGSAPPQDGILGDNPLSTPPSGRRHRSHAQSPLPPRHAPNFRGGLSRPQANKARAGVQVSSDPHGGLAGSGGGAAGAGAGAVLSAGSAGAAQYDPGVRDSLLPATSGGTQGAAGTTGDALGREWTVWTDSTRPGVLSSEDLDLDAASRRDISTWTEFWSFWGDVKEGRIELSEGANLCMFVRGVKPTWEDSLAHGKFRAQLD